MSDPTMSDSPKPEEGVPRYEVFRALPLSKGYQFDVSTDSLREARIAIKEWMRPAYIYDRKTGEVIATNKEALKARDESAQDVVTCEECEHVFTLGRPLESAPQCPACGGVNTVDLFPDGDPQEVSE